MTFSQFGGARLGLANATGVPAHAKAYRRAAPSLDHRYLATAQLRAASPLTIPKSVMRNVHKFVDCRNFIRALPFQYSDVFPHPAIYSAIFSRHV